MVEISLSGSGEGPGRVTSRPTLQRLLLRFERIQQRHYGMKLMAYTLINLRSVVSKTRNQLIRMLWGDAPARFRET
jgi:hypothetical protein